MSWTVACFCGNIYTTPPDCCEVCGRSTEPAPEGSEPAPAHRRDRHCTRDDARAANTSAGNATRRKIVSGKNGYRTGIPHGVSTVTGGQRAALGVIFHDAEREHATHAPPERRAPQWLPA
jgi:Oxygenase, catalysing oxidative methylation of damaged DNA